MGQANSVQREPSMEEILASIRRIIEDSDASRKGSGEPENPPVPPARHAESADIAAFRTGLHGKSPAADTRLDPAEQFGAASGLPVSGDASRSASPVVEASVHEFSFSTPASLRAGNHQAQPGDEIEMELEIDGLLDGAPEPENAAPGEANGARNPIISEGAGRQVAASFGELSDALSARGRKSFDQIAEEMMRPLLQDWLDNNLPLLVERLVREEIERIARGGTAAPR